ncbi:MAG: FtsH protease activity modulator HflK [Halofilum sp. (in: g-proteobacteria)]
MAWNEPGGGKDPWGNRGGGGDGGPPDLDEAFRKLKQRLSGMFGGGTRRPSGGGSNGGGGLSEGLAWGLLGLAFVGWLGSGLYIIDPPERAVVTRFGAFQEVVGPGPHWHLPWPIESSEVVNVAQNRSQSINSQLMLTSDEKIVRINLSFQYDVRDPQAFLFNVRMPEQTLNQVVEASLRQVVGNTQMDQVITAGRGEVAQQIHDMSQQIVDAYGTGLNIQAVNLQQATAPDPVQDAYQDVNRAREDRERFVNEAQALRNRIVPEARGEAAQRLEDARAYRTRVVESAEGETDRFLALLEEYQQSPEVTRKRLYIDTMQEVLGKTGKVLVDSEGEGRNLIYVPLDRMLKEVPESDSQGSSSGRTSTTLPGVASDSGSSRGNRPTRSRESN